MGTALTLRDNPPFLILGLYSPVPRSGKSTAAKYLAEALGFQQASFADPLKTMIFTLLDHFVAGTDQEKAERVRWILGHKEEPLPEVPGQPSFRKLAQTLGTDWGRDMIDPQLWVTASLRTVAKAKASGFAGVVFDDIRFPNEADAVKAMGGAMVKITRPDAPNIFRIHQSEGALERYPFDAALHNADSEFSFVKGIDVLCAALRLKRTAT